MAVLIGTWSFSLDAIKIGKHLLMQGSSALDVVEKSIAAIEDAHSYGVYYVGRGGCPNSSGQLECDAALMDGQHLNFGAVAALQGVAAPIHVARLVMDKCQHSMLVGQGAAEFAISQGVVLEPNDRLAGVQQLPDPSSVGKKQHDTLGLIARDKRGNLAVGVSTSGMANKSPGRVGDSPLPGCGLYADNDVGAACTTGDGDELLKFCPSHWAVMLMANGLHPRDACKQLVREISNRHKSIQMGIVAMNKKGEVGAAGTVKDWKDVRTSKIYSGFPYGLWSEKEFPKEDVLVEEFY